MDSVGILIVEEVVELALQFALSAAPDGTQTQKIVTSLVNVLPLIEKVLPDLVAKIETIIEIIKGGDTLTADQVTQLSNALDSSISRRAAANAAAKAAGEA